MIAHRFRGAVDSWTSSIDGSLFPCKNETQRSSSKAWPIFPFLLYHQAVAFLNVLKHTPHTSSLLSEKNSLSSNQYIPILTWPAKSQTA